MSDKTMAVSRAPWAPLKFGARVLGLALAVGSFGPPAGATFYTPANGVPVMDGSFTTPQEWANAGKVRDDLNVGWFYNQYTENWHSSNTLSFFKMHAFDDPGYGQLDTYDLNSFEFTFGANTVKTWVFEPGECPPDLDPLWLGEVGLGDYTSLLDDGGFLVRLNGDPLSDRIWRPGMAQPGDPGWDFTQYYGVFAFAGFDNSAFVQGYSDVVEPRELYEWSITLNKDPLQGGVFGIPGGPGNPVPPPLCSLIWEFVTLERTDDWKPSMGGWGIPGGPGWKEQHNFVNMGIDPSLHPIPIPEPATYGLAAGAALALLALGAKRRRSK